MGAFAPKISKLDFIQRSKTAKWLALLLVLLFLIHGIACVAVSAWMETMTISDCQFMAPYMVSVHLLLTYGCFTVVLGICIIYLMLRRQTRNLCHGFILGLAFTLVFELTAAIVATVHQDMVQSSKFQTEMEEFNILKHKSKENNWDMCWTMIQRKYKCCGITDYSDWLNVSLKETSTHETQTNITIDVGESSLFQSCACNEKGAQCFNVHKYGNIYQRSCLAITREKLSFIYFFIRIFAPIFAVFQFIALVWVSFILTKLSSSSIVAAYAVKDVVKTNSTESVHI